MSRGPYRRRESYSHPEQCRFCGCTEETPCQLVRITVASAANDTSPKVHSHAEICHWRDATKRCCTNPDCLAKELIRRKGQ